MKRHILINGERNVGKSTLIRRLVEEAGCPVYGFCTQNEEPDEKGFHDIYIHPAGQAFEERVFTSENKIGRCDTRIHDVNPEVFDTAGVKYMEDVRADGIIVMDELGFMEKDSPLFMARVKELLEGDVHVIAAVKNRKDVPFLNEVRAMPKAEIFDITRENREELFETLRKITAKWE